jgi:hypothetical protein
MDGGDPNTHHSHPSFFMSPYFLEELKNKIKSHLDYLGSSMSQKYSRVILLSLLTCSQIWLSPLVDGFASPPI